MVSKEESNQKKKGLFKKLVDFCCLFSAFVVVLSGLIVLLTRPIAPQAFDQIIITSDNDVGIVDFNRNILPGDSKDYELKIESKIFENVKYDIKFEGYESCNIGRFFYVSASIGDEVLINNTLDEIFEYTPIIKNRILKSFETNVIKFNFAISPMVDFSYDVSFCIVIEAKGKLLQ